MLFLSGVYGVLQADEPVPLYDHALASSEVDALRHPCAARLRALGITSLTGVLCARDQPGWAPYWALLEGACRGAGVGLEVRIFPGGR